MAEEVTIAPPPLRLEQYFLGASTAVGMFEDRFGAVRRRMSIALDGRMDGDTFVLDERFLFDDGEQERRIWRITPQGQSAYSATADDMIGSASGETGVNGVAWSYLFSLRIGARRLKVRFHETFTPVSADVMINRARVTKFGILIGRTTIVFRRNATP